MRPRKSARSSKRLFLYFLVRCERANRHPVTKKLDLPPLPVTLHAALVGGEEGASLRALRITMPSIDSIRFDSQSDAARFYTRSCVLLLNYIVTFFRLSYTRKNPIAIASVSAPLMWLIRHSANPPPRVDIIGVMIFSWGMQYSSAAENWSLLKNEICIILKLIY